MENLGLQGENLARNIIIQTAIYVIIFKQNHDCDHFWGEKFSNINDS